MGQALREEEDKDRVEGLVGMGVKAETAATGALGVESPLAATSSKARRSARTAGSS